MVESNALLKRRTPKGYRGFESLPHRAFSIPSFPSGDRINKGSADRMLKNAKLPRVTCFHKKFVANCRKHLGRENASVSHICIAQIRNFHRNGEPQAFRDAAFWEI